MWNIFITIVQLYLLVVVDALANSEIFFLTTPGDTTARVGQTATLYCSVNQPSDSRFLWIKDDAIISQGYNLIGLTDPHRFSIIGHDTSYNLRITNVQLNDAGSYKCIVTSATAGILSDPAHFEVFAAPSSDLPKCSTNSSLSVAVGEIVQLTCAVAGGRPAPNISVYQNYQEVSHNELGEDTATYTWTVTGGDHGTIFQCEGRHDLWAESRHCQLGPFTVVTDPVEVILVPLSEIVEVGYSTSFVCHQSVPLRSTFSWLVDGIPVESVNTPYSTHTGDISSILRIDTVPRALDGSTITCVVETATDTFARETTLILSMVPTRTSPSTILNDKNSYDTTEVSRSNQNGYDDVTDNVDFIQDKTEETIPADQSVADVFLTAILPASGIVAVTIFAVLVVVLTRMRRVALKMYSDSQVMVNEGSIVPADQDDYYFKSKFVSVHKTWFGPVHNDTVTGISNSFPLAEGPRMLIEIAGNDDEVPGSTDA